LGGRRTSFGKLERDRAKKAKAAAKRERRHERPDPDAEPLEDALAEPAAELNGGSETSASDLLEQIEEIHRQFDAGTISYEHFEETKAELLGRLTVD